MNLPNQPSKDSRLDALLDPWCPPRRKALLPFGVFVAFYFGFALQKHQSFLFFKNSEIQYNIFLSNRQDVLIFLLYFLNKVW